MIEDIRYLIVFAKIAEVGTISGGAEALGIATATASEHLSRLEKNLDTALLYRNTRKLSLSRDGVRLLETARAMLELYEKGVIEFRQRSISTAARLHVSIPAVFINGPFTAHLAAFVRAHPQLGLRISCQDGREDIVAEGIDLAFRIGELPDSGLKARHLFLLPRRVVAAPSLLAGSRWSRTRPSWSGCRGSAWPCARIRAGSGMRAAARRSRSGLCRRCGWTTWRPLGGWPPAASAWRRRRIT